MSTTYPYLGPPASRELGEIFRRRVGLLCRRREYAMGRARQAISARNEDERQKWQDRAVEAHKKIRRMGVDTVEVGYRVKGWRYL